MLEKINNYIKNNDFYLTLYENKIYITNFERIILLEENHISLQSSHKIISIDGTHLTLNKLVEKEVLITGNLRKIEVTNV